MNYRFFFSFFPFASAAVALFLFVLPCRVGVRAQAVWAMVLLLAAAKFVCFGAFGGDTFNPELPVALVWGWNLLYSGMTILSALALPGLLVPRRVRLFLLPALAWGIAAWGLWCGVRAPDVKEVELAFADLPASLDGYRLAQISDTHISSSMRRWRTEEIVRRTNAARPDLICLTGDFADGIVRLRWRDAEPLKDLRARDGVYACTGNHEYYGEGFDWLRRFVDWDIRFLSNACVTPHPGLALGGVEDVSGSPYAPNADVGKAFADAPQGAFRVLLQHRPASAAENARRHGVRLQLSGHTHGGITPVFAPLIAKFNGGFVRGIYELANGAQLYVSPGSGQWAGFPLRVLNDSEITVFTLRRNAAAPAR